MTKGKKVKVDRQGIVLNLTVSPYFYCDWLFDFYVHIDNSKMFCSLCLHFACFPGAREGLIDKLSDEAQIRMTLASSAFKSVSEKFLSGEIQMKTLDQILQREQEFVDLLKIGESEYLYISSSSSPLPPFSSLSSLTPYIYFLSMKLYIELKVVLKC